MIINVILNFILIPLYGITGAAVATLISYSVAVFSIGFFPKTMNQFFMMIKAVIFLDLFKYPFKKFEEKQ